MVLKRCWLARHWSLCVRYGNLLNSINLEHKLSASMSIWSFWDSSFKCVMSYVSNNFMVEHKITLTWERWVLIKMRTWNCRLCTSYLKGRAEFLLVLSLFKCAYSFDNKNKVLMASIFILKRTIRLSTRTGYFMKWGKMKKGKLL